MFFYSDRPWLHLNPSWFSAIVLSQCRLSHWAFQTIAEFWFFLLLLFYFVVVVLYMVKDTGLNMNILLNMNVEFFRNYLLKMRTFSSAENQMTVVMHTRVWLFNSAPLVYMLIFVSVPYCFCYYDSVIYLEVEWKGGRFEDTYNAYLVYCHMFWVRKQALKYHQQVQPIKFTQTMSKNKTFFL